MVPISKTLRNAHRTVPQLPEPPSSGGGGHVYRLVPPSTIYIFNIFILINKLINFTLFLRYLILFDTYFTLNYKGAFKRRVSGSMCPLLFNSPWNFLYSAIIFTYWELNVYENSLKCPIYDFFQWNVIYIYDFVIY